MHNDLRSPNVCIMSLDPDSKEPIGKILDFGLSEILAIKERFVQFFIFVRFEDFFSWFSTMNFYTHFFLFKRTSLMTWQWIAPEVLSHYLCDHAVDIYRFLFNRNSLLLFFFF